MLAAGRLGCNSAASSRADQTCLVCIWFASGFRLVFVWFAPRTKRVTLPAYPLEPINPGGTHGP